HDWPGNVRELRNTVRRAVLLSNDVIELQHLRQRAAPPGAAPPCQGTRRHRTKAVAYMPSFMTPSSHSKKP
ncbi:MAG TPA: hypothetical protein VEP90_25290, partial [Methylomirabilota bacterium]|nr:hypothetical protein [Methylomirabilota bacterium]